MIHAPRPALALYQPDIAGNTGTLIRLSACLASELHIIDPAGFRHDDTALRRAGMDYADLASITRHADFAAFEAWRAGAGQTGAGRRLVLLTTRVETAYTDFAFRPGDLLLLGRESAGVPDTVHAACDAAVTIPMAPGARSLNQAVSAAMVLGEALRQTDGFSDRPASAGSIG
ncbi:MAG: tRNA (cytidine(34)-2'-O)-methyltransferase [Nitratireductor sp.]|nr:tRNA (cytidine(34)-2'-O)-methyltransferase [Nitratireductor sp.]